MKSSAVLQQVKSMFSTGRWEQAYRVLSPGYPWWTRLRKGTVLRFGLLEQPELSGKRLPISGFRSYRFGEMDFTAWELGDHEKPVCSLIIAGEAQQQPYLAISRRLSERDREKLFTEEDLALLPDTASLKTLYVREQLHGYRAWVTMKYRRRLEGVHGSREAGGSTLPFVYALYVSEDNDRAIEIERYEDGSLEVYATLYRPVTDVVSTNKPPAALPPLPAAPVRAGARTADILPMKNESAAPEEEAAQDDVPEPEPESTVAPPEEEGAEPMVGAGDQLPLNLYVAARILNEAIRSEVPLSDLLRKVLGLPVHMRDMVNFTLPLTEDDYHELAARYGVDPEDTAAIRTHITQELSEFSGESAEARRHAS